MKQPSFELTPAQKGLLASLLDETGQPVPTLMAAIANAMEELQEREQRDAGGETNGHETVKPIWELFEEASLQMPDAEVERLPTDLAAQVDHYVYGLPKR